MADSHANTKVECNRSGPTHAELQLIEMRMAIEMVDSMSDELAHGLGMRRLLSRDGLLLAMKQVRFQYFNRLVGFGIEKPGTEQALDRALDWLRANANPCWGLDILNPTVEMTHWLAARGLTDSGVGEARLWRASELAAPPIACEFHVEKIGPKDARVFGSLVQTVFGLPSAAAEWCGDLVRHKHWHCYVVYCGSTPIATGSVRLADSVAVLAMGATLPAYRGRGAQSASIARRINDAIALGAKHIITTTEFPCAGQQMGSSLRNMLKSGFTVSFVRPTYVMGSNH
jgi:hypothetical protein